jgi:hypothetical protein
MTEAGGTKAGASIGLGAPAFLAGADLGQRGGSGVGREKAGDRRRGNRPAAAA